MPKKTSYGRKRTYAKRTSRIVRQPVVRPDGLVKEKISFIVDIKMKAEPSTGAINGFLNVHLTHPYQGLDNLNMSTSIVPNNVFFNADNR